MLSYVYFSETHASSLPNLHLIIWAAIYPLYKLFLMSQAFHSTSAYYWVTDFLYMRKIAKNNKH